MKVIVREFKKSMLHEELRKKWVSDDAWVQLLTDTYHLDGLSLKLFNRAISRSTEYSMLDSLQSNKRVMRKVRGSKRYFYYVTKPGEVYDNKKEMLKGTKAWRKAFDYNRLKQSSRSKAKAENTEASKPKKGKKGCSDDEEKEGTNDDGQVSPDGDSSDPNPSINLEQTKRQGRLYAGDFWSDMKTRKLFGSVDEESALATLIRRNELLMEMQNDSDVLTSHVNKAENHPLTLHQHTKVLCRCQLLRRAYDGETSWISCCEKAIKELAPVLSDTPKPRTLATFTTPTLSK
jgi:hypothetical protein